MAWTKADLDELDAAIVSGALKVKYADREITYQTIPDMIRARALIERKIAIDQGEASSGRRFAAFSKGM
jgi:hypothetical protein